MNIEVKITKDIPEKDIKKFEDRTVYYAAVLTREYTKSLNAYPYLSGELARQEIRSPITGKDAEYNLLAGTRYAKIVYNFKNANWTNKSTKPQWYNSVYRQKEKTIINDAQKRAIGEIK
jgi:hypothetical protein